MNREQILEKWRTPTKIGPDGHVRLVDFMGSDDAVVQAARVSYGKGTKAVSEDRHLIRYLMRHRHTTPFEMVVLKFHIRIPMDAWRQMIRHRTASVNEYSTRYSEAIDSRATTGPGEWRLQSKSNKQGSAGMIQDDWADLEDTIGEPGFTNALARGLHPGEYLSAREGDLHRLGKEIYKERLAFGVAREQARKDLPLSTYTEAYWEMNLHNLLHFLRLRMHPHAQLEIRQFANAIYEIVKDVVPVTAEAFEDYALGGCYFSREEMACLHAWLENELELSKWDNEKIKEILGQFINTKRERQEFWKKING